MFYRLAESQDNNVFKNNCMYIFVYQYTHDNWVKENCMIFEGKGKNNNNPVSLINTPNYFIFHVNKTCFLLGV